MGDVFERLKAAGVGMGIRNSDDYLFSMTVTEAIIVRDRIEELEAALKATEAETPAFPSTDDPSARLSDETASDYVLQAEFQAHKRHTALNQQAQSERNLWLTDRLEDQERRIRTLERRMSEGSLDGVLQKLNGLATNTPSPPEHESEDKTPEPPQEYTGPLYTRTTEGGLVVQERCRRSGRERRELLFEETPSGRHYVRGTHFYLNRRATSRRKSDRK